MYYQGEWYCKWCARPVRYPTESGIAPKALGKGKGTSRQDNRRRLPIPARQTQQQRAQQDAEPSAEAKEQETPRATAPLGKDEQDNRSPEDLLKLYQIIVEQVGETDILAQAAKTRWQKADAIKREEEARKRGPASIEKQVHIAKERIGRMQKKVQRAQAQTLTKREQVAKCEEALQLAKQQVEEALLGEQQAELGVKQAQEQYTGLVAKLRQQAAPQHLAQDLLFLIGVDTQEEVPEQSRHHMQAAHEMLQQVINTVAAAKQADEPMQEEPQTPAVVHSSAGAKGSPTEAGTPAPSKREASPGGSEAATP